MSIPSPVTVPGVQPMTGDERARAGRVASRLYGDLNRLHTKLPEHAQGGSGMARYLGITRNTCQRVSLALADETASLETLIKLPGVKGLEQMLEALRAKGFEASDIELAGASVRAFDELINDLAGSHTRLIARLSAIDAAAIDDEAFASKAREQLTMSAANIMGRLADVAVSLYIFRPDVSDASVLHRVLAAGFIGNRLVQSGMPIVLSSGREEMERARDTGPTSLDESPLRGSTPRAILEPFTTKPLPTITTRGTGDDVVQVIDPASLAEGETFDIVTALRSVHPMLDAETGRPTLNEVWALVNVPSRHKVFDVYLHRDMEREYRPSIDALLWYPNLVTPPSDRWATRFPSQPKLELLGRGLERAECKGYARQKELSRFLFERLGWDAGEFVGFRVELAYPIWRAGYCMSFEYLGG